ncbi:hypothetical protein [Micromonospora sp. WMMD964]|uniref:hypothetical protein n=1 Tax=Micromonospora sp. WMMD964 TaxID=3016091 RepID=UPI00249C1770|nr:hypothetical protein [Micromonospora sp. WMMD964]WFE99973.1 hypothetical protein O7616_24205 [Micromonospora sp. WMMD964]
MAEEQVWPYRPQALTSYRGGLHDGPARSPIRSSRRPLVALAALLVVCLGFAAVMRVPQAVEGAVIGADGSYLVSLFAGRLDPQPAQGTAVTLAQADGRTTLRVVRAEVVVDDAAARRWNIPAEVARPVTVVLLSGNAAQSFGRLSLVVANPTLLELVPGLEGVL